MISAILILLVLVIRFAAERIEQNNFYKEVHWKELIDYVLIAVLFSCSEILVEMSGFR